MRDSFQKSLEVGLRPRRCHSYFVTSSKLEYSYKLNGGSPNRLLAEKIMAGEMSERVDEEILEASHYEEKTMFTQETRERSTQRGSFLQLLFGLVVQSIKMTK